MDIIQIRARTDMVGEARNAAEAKSLFLQELHKNFDELSPGKQRFWTNNYEFAKERLGFSDEKAKEAADGTMWSFSDERADFCDHCGAPLNKD